MSKKAYQIPFDKNDEMMNYPESWENPIWKDNYEWEDELKYESYGRGRSAAYMIFVSTQTNKTYTMFLTDFDSIVSLLSGGALKGTFTFQKRGQNYGVRLVR
jgi:hypothetical protein